MINIHVHRCLIHMEIQIVIALAQRRIWCIYIEAVKGVDRRCHYSTGFMWISTQERGVINGTKERGVIYGNIGARCYKRHVRARCYDQQSKNRMLCSATLERGVTYGNTRTRFYELQHRN